MYTTKKLIAVVLSALMLLGLLAGCGGTADAPETTEALQQGSTPVGVLLVSMGAEFQISYDAEGFVIGINGANNAGRTVAASVSSFLGRDCAYTVRALLDQAVADKRTENAKNLVIRVGVESEIPSEGFLENIGQDVQYKCDELGSGIMVKLVTDTELTPEGYINVATAKKLAANQAGLQDVAALEGSSEPASGVYTFTFGEEDEKDTVTVEASTGTVSLASELLAEEDPDAEEDPVVDLEESGEEEELLEQTDPQVSNQEGEDLMLDDEEVTD